MIKRNFLNTKEMIKEGILEEQERRKNYRISKNVDEYNSFFFSSLIYGLCLMVKAKILTLFNVALNVYIRNILKLYYIKTIIL